MVECFFRTPLTLHVVCFLGVGTKNVEQHFGGISGTWVASLRQGEFVEISCTRQSGPLWHLEESTAEKRRVVGDVWRLLEPETAMRRV